MGNFGTEELVEALAASLQREQGQVKAILEAFGDVIVSALRSGAVVELEGFFKLGAGNGAKGQRLSMVELGNLLAQRLAVDATECGALLLQTLELMKKRLTEEQGFELPSIGTFQTRHEKAKVQKDPKRGHRVIARPRRILIFQAAGTLEQELSSRKLVLQWEPAFLQSVEEAKRSRVMLVFPERDSFVELLDYYFRRAGWNTAVVTVEQQALDLLSSQGAYLVILDSNLAGYQKLCEAIKCARQDGLTPIIVLFPKEANLDRPREFMVCGDEHVQQPFEIKNLLKIADSEVIRAAEEEAFFEQQVQFHFPTEESAIERANEFGHRLFELSGLSEEDQVAMAAALREAIGNAAQHGNKYRRDKKVEVLYLRDHEKITMTVRDMGQGFDHTKFVARGEQADALAAARERHREGKLGGLGIMLMLRCCDKVEYNDVGNQLTLTKHLQSKQPAPA